MTKLKLAIAWLLVCVLLYTMNCGGGGTNPLSITLSANQVFVLPGDLVFDESDTCYAEGTLSEPRFRIDNLQSSYTGDGTFTAVVVQVKVSGVTGIISEYSCAISGGGATSMGVFLNYRNATIIGSGAGGDGDEFLDTNEEATSTCPIHCGAVTVNSEEAFSVSATVRLVGIETVDDNGTEVQRPLTAEETLILRGLP